MLLAFRAEDGNGTAVRLPEDDVHAHAGESQRHGLFAQHQVGEQEFFLENEWLVSKKLWIEAIADDEVIEWTEHGLELVIGNSGPPTRQCLGCLLLGPREEAEHLGAECDPWRPSDLGPCKGKREHVEEGDLRGVIML